MIPEMRKEAHMLRGIERGAAEEFRKLIAAVEKFQAGSMTVGQVCSRFSCPRKGGCAALLRKHRMHAPGKFKPRAKLSLLLTGLFCPFCALPRLAFVLSLKTRMRACKAIQPLMAALVLCAMLSSSQGPK